MNTIEQYPESLVNVSPGEGFSRLQVPEGEAIHTGGLYLSPDGKEVWKPLDVKPYQNCPFRVPSREKDVLEFMENQPGFPKNWRVEVSNGRTFLVRLKCLVVGQDVDLEYLSLDDILKVEQWVRSLNSQYWEINDHITLAFDKERGELFILDLSAAQLKGGSSDPWVADDTTIFHKFATSCGFTKLVKLRQDARNLTSDLILLRLQGENLQLTENHKHIYASSRRPINGGWAKIPNAVYMDADKSANVWTWVITPELLPQEVIYQYELTWAYSPIQRKG